MKALYRKHNDRTLCSSTYHKKDGTAVRQKLRREAEAEVAETQAESVIDRIKL